MEEHYGHLFTKETEEFCQRLEVINRREKFGEVTKEELSRANQMWKAGVALEKAAELNPSLRDTPTWSTLEYQMEVLGDFFDAYREWKTPTEKKADLRRQVMENMCQRMVKRFLLFAKNAPTPESAVGTNTLWLWWRREEASGDTTEIRLTAYINEDVYTVFFDGPAIEGSDDYAGEKGAFNTIYPLLLRLGFCE
jgi:hypothetical protein